jgi:hypothetical protein
MKVYFPVSFHIYSSTSPTSSVSVSLVVFQILKTLVWPVCKNDSVNIVHILKQVFSLV